ncbi:PTS sugar transporter subunit IIA [Orbaceae bacterium ESL0727]|nr:PTS sugar transporter subunit IIA [Orbaceae bacterium ESL0727]
MVNECNQHLFFDDLIFLDKVFQKSDQFFDFVFPILQQGGYVKESFLAAIKKREAAFPTALPTTPYVVAMPHTDIEHIIRPFILVTRIKGSVPWCEMANNDVILDANFIFLLGFTGKDGHILLLQTLIASFSNPQFLAALQQAKTKQAVMALLTANITF